MVAGVGLLALDRMQIFYGSELRPYACLALVVLLAWCGLRRWSHACLFDRDDRDPIEANQPPRLHAEWWYLWIGLASLAFWLHPIAVLPIAAQIFFAAAFLTWHRRTLLSTPRARVRLAALVICSLIVLMVQLFAARHVLSVAWQNRQQWSAFAGTLQWVRVSRLLPMHWLLGPLALAYAMRVVRQSSISKPQRPQSSDDASVPRDTLRCDWWMWLIAWCLPLLTVVLLAALRIAPLLHERYLFACTAPLVLWTMLSLSFSRSACWRLAILLFMFVSMTVQQGTWSTIANGQLPRSHRNEDWRGAVQWITDDSSERTGHENKKVIVLLRQQLDRRHSIWRGSTDRVERARAVPGFSTQFAVSVPSQLRGDCIVE